MHGQRGTFVRMYMPTFVISNTIRFTSTKTDAFRFSHPQRRLKTYIRVRTFRPASRGAARVGWLTAGAQPRPV